MKDKINLELVETIFKESNPNELLTLFNFNKTITPEILVNKYRLWIAYFFPLLFKDKEAPFHYEMDLKRARIFLSKGSFLNIAFRGSAKTTRAKAFRAFTIANDIERHRKYYRVISKDLNNAVQIVTDVFNMLVSPRVKALYPNIFVKTDAKREEKQSSFTTTNGIKMIATSILPDQRGNVQGSEEVSRPDFDLYEDIETRISLMSAVITDKISKNMEEARTGLEKEGSSEYNCNYISETGNVHKLVKKIDNQLIIPIIENGIPTWNRYTLEDIEIIKKEADDFEGEYLCKPNASKDIYFDRDKLDAMVIRQPIKEISGFKIFKEYNAGHRYAGGHDIAGGVGLDSSTSVFIDFDTIPAQVVGTFHSNTILPEAFGDEVYSQGNRFGGCLLGIENNKFDQTILKAKQLGADLFMTPAKAIKAGFSSPTTYGWNTNSLTKSKMLPSLREAIESGLLDLNDEELINECKGFTRNDLIDNPPDIRLTTRHWDLVTALAISWQMKDYCRQVKIKKVYYSNAVVSNPAI